MTHFFFKINGLTINSLELVIKNINKQLKVNQPHTILKRSYEFEQQISHNINYFPGIIIQGGYPLKKLSYIQFLYQMET